MKGRRAAGKNGMEWGKHISTFLHISHTIDPGCSCPWHFSFFGYVFIFFIFLAKDGD